MTSNPRRHRRVIPQLSPSGWVLGFGKNQDQARGLVFGAPGLAERGDFFEMQGAHWARDKQRDRFPGPVGAILRANRSNSRLLICRSSSRADQLDFIASIS